MTRRLRVALASVMLAVSALGCSKDAPEEDEARLELYQVPPGMEDQVRRLLTVTLGAPEGLAPKGAVAVAPGGRLLVLTTPQIHAGIASLVSSLADAQPPPASPSVELTYWLVLGDQTPGDQSGDELSEIRAALDSIAEELDVRRFRLLERVQVRGRSGERAIADGVRARVEQLASVVGDLVVAQVGVEIRGRPAQVRTELSLAPDDLVVLAQTGSPLPPSREGTEGEGRLLFYIVRARLIDA